MGTEKALLPWKPTHPADTVGLETFVSANVKALLPVVDLVIVVLGTNHLLVAPFVYAAGASVAVNPSPENGQFSSLQVGLREVLNRGRDAAIVTLVDRPPVNSLTMRLLVECFRAQDSNQKWAVIPEYAGKHGHPVIFGREMIESVLRAPFDSSARDIEHTHQPLMDYVVVEDRFAILNVDTPTDYKALLTP